MRVQYVTTSGYENFDSIDDFRAASGRLGITENGSVDSTHSNALLQGLPKFQQLAGPLGPQCDGTEVRYETWKAFEIYSS